MCDAPYGPHCKRHCSSPFKIRIVNYHDVQLSHMDAAHQERLELETTRPGFVAYRLKFGVTQRRCAKRPRGSADEAASLLNRNRNAHHIAQGDALLKKILPLFK